jgi:predicted DNA-binding transcriptional regulator AlpA
MQKPEIIRPVALATLLGVSRSTILRWRKDGVLPPPRELGPGVTGWSRREIDEWIESRRKLS